MPKVETLEMLLRSGQYERAACRLVYGLVKARVNQMERERNREEIAASPVAPRKDRGG